MTPFPTQHNPDQVSAPASFQVRQTRNTGTLNASPPQKIPVDFRALVYKQLIITELRTDRYA